MGAGDVPVNPIAAYCIRLMLGEEQNEAGNMNVYGRTVLAAPFAPRGRTSSKSLPRKAQAELAEWLRTGLQSVKTGSIPVLASTTFSST